jgi:hypothetical protein
MHGKHQNLNHCLAPRHAKRNTRAIHESAKLLTFKAFYILALAHPQGPAEDYFLTLAK